MYSVYDVGGMSKEQIQSRQYFVTSKEKVYITPSTIGPGLLNPQTTKPVIVPPELSKKGQITPQDGFGGWFCLCLFYLFQLNL